MSLVLGSYGTHARPLAPATVWSLRAVLPPLCGQNHVCAAIRARYSKFKPLYHADIMQGSTTGQTHTGSQPPEARGWNPHCTSSSQLFDPFTPSSSPLMRSASSTSPKLGYATRTYTRQPLRSLNPRLSPAPPPPVPLPRHASGSPFVLLLFVPLRRQSRGCSTA